MADITASRDQIVEWPRRRVDLDKLEHEITAPSQSATPPMTAEGVLQQHEAAAKAVEAMRDEVNSSAAGLQASLDQCGATGRLLEDAANSIRENGKRHALQIEAVNARLTEIQRMCASFKEKLGD